LTISLRSQVLSLTSNMHVLALGLPSRCGLGRSLPRACLSQGGVPTLQMSAATLPGQYGTFRLPVLVDRVLVPGLESPTCRRRCNFTTSTPSGSGYGTVSTQRNLRRRERRHVGSQGEIHWCVRVSKRHPYSLVCLDRPTRRLYLRRSPGPHVADNSTGCLASSSTRSTDRCIVHIPRSIRR